MTLGKSPDLCRWNLCNPRQIRTIRMLPGACLHTTLTEHTKYRLNNSLSSDNTCNYWKQLLHIKETYYTSGDITLAKQIYHKYHKMSFIYSHRLNFHFFYLDLVETYRHNIRHNNGEGELIIWWDNHIGICSLILDREGKRTEGNIGVREKDQSVASHMCPNQQSHPQPGYVPWLGIKPAVFWRIGWCSNQLSQAARTCAFKGWPAYTLRRTGCREVESGSGESTWDASAVVPAKEEVALG